ncbi:glycosyltransferase family 39 protein [bacterium]|nr:glycosyltransferase family 39 protein [bacterium]
MEEKKFPSRRLFLALACAGLLLRLLLVIFRPGILGTDEVIYDPLGWNLASEGRYLLDGNPATWPPGYPAFLAVIYLVFGHSSVAVGVFQSLLDVLAGIILASLGVRHFGTRAGLTILALWMFLPARAILPSLLISEATFLVFFIIALALFAKRGWVEAIINGVLWAAILYTRPVTLLAIVVLAIGRWKYEKWRTLIPIGLAALLLLPYAIWNLQKHGSFTIYTGVGMNFYMGHNAESSGGYGIPEGPLPWDSLTTSGEVAINEVAFKAGLRDMLVQPWREVKLLASKAALFFMSDIPFLLVYSPHKEDAELSLRQQIAVRPLGVRLLIALPYMVLVLLAWTGLFFLNYWKDNTIWYTSALTFFMASLVFVALPRYHEPLMPLFVLLAGAIFAKPRSQRHHPGRWAIWIWRIGFIGLIAIWIAEWVVVLNA